MQFFKDNGVYYHAKRGFNKANFAEHMIHLIKRKLFIQLRVTNRRDWQNILSQVVDNLNNTGRKFLGGLKPINLNSYTSATAVDRAVGFSKESQYSDHQTNVDRFNAKTDLNVGDYAYISPKKALRSFDIQVLTYPLLVRHDQSYPLLVTYS